MTVSAFVCRYCGPTKVIPTTDGMKQRASPPSHWCPTCGQAVSVHVVHDDPEPTDAAVHRQLA